MSVSMPSLIKLLPVEFIHVCRGLAFIYSCSLASIMEIILVSPQQAWAAPVLLCVRGRAVGSTAVTQR